MAGVISLIVLVLVWRFVFLWGAEVFRAAGLNPQAARFEARSALTGSGYTTDRSEAVVTNPVAQKVASWLILTSYFGPGLFVALLGVTFVLPNSDEDLSTRVLTLFVAIAAIVLLDVVGVLRRLGSRPAASLARRMLGAGTYESWIVLGDRAVGQLTVPRDMAQAEPLLAALTSPSVTVLAVESGSAAGPGTRPVESAGPGTDHPGPGDRVVVFGPEEELRTLGMTS